MSLPKTLEGAHVLIATLRAEVERLDVLINNPHTEDFLESVRTEAGHQVLRWSKGHDEEKSQADWFWLIGYLGGKAIRPGEENKRLHRIITIAAAAMNWHKWEVTRQANDSGNVPKKAAFRELSRAEIALAHKKASAEFRGLSPKDKLERMVECGAISAEEAKGVARTLANQYEGPASPDVDADYDGIPRCGDVVSSDGSELLVLAVELVPDWVPSSEATLYLRGVPRKLKSCFEGVGKEAMQDLVAAGWTPGPLDVGPGWMSDLSPESRSMWLPWRCTLLRRDALDELDSSS